VSDRRLAGISRLVHCVVAVGLLWSGADMIFSGLASRKGGDASLEWPAVQGRIRSAAIVPYEDRKRVRYRVRILYDYKVLGRRYTGNGIFFKAAVTKDSEDQARRFLADYPEGGEAKVYYNPEDPGEAVLRPGRTAEGRGSLGLGIVVLLMGAFLMAKGLRMNGEGESR